MQCVLIKNINSGAKMLYYTHSVSDQVIFGCVPNKKWNQLHKICCLKYMNCKITCFSYFNYSILTNYMYYMVKIILVFCGFVVVWFGFFLPPHFWGTLKYFIRRPTSWFGICDIAGVNLSDNLFVLLTYLKCWIQNIWVRMKIRHESGQQQHIFSYKLLKFYGK